jgi:hypothetical protein
MFFDSDSGICLKMSPNVWLDSTFATPDLIKIKSSCFRFMAFIFNSDQTSLWDRLGAWSIVSSRALQNYTTPAKFIFKISKPAVEKIIQ